jgi:hypothetical protein
MLALLLAAALAAPAVAPSASIDSLSWMAGSWASDSAGVRVEEHWMAPLGGQMIGMHRDVARGRVAGFEFLRVAPDSAAGLAYVSMPGGRPPTRFPLKSLRERGVVFENPTHDFPQRILYWLDDAGRLHARIEGTLRGQPASENWVWRPSALAP